VIVLEETRTAFLRISPLPLIAELNPCILSPRAILGEFFPSLLRIREPFLNFRQAQAGNRARGGSIELRGIGKYLAVREELSPCSLQNSSPRTDTPSSRSVSRSSQSPKPVTSPVWLPAQTEWFGERGRLRLAQWRARSMRLFAVRIYVET
jgi:hypothetical protein